MATATMETDTALPPCGTFRAPFDAIAFNPELETALDPLTESEFDELKTNVLRDGRFLDPIIVWKRNGYEILIDGRNRLQVWSELPPDSEIAPPEIEYLDFPDVKAAKAWMLAHQLGRRNLSPLRASYYRGQLYNLVKRPPAENLKTGSKLPKDQIDPSGKSTAERIAEQSGVSAPTVKRDGRLAAALDRITQVDPEFRADFLAGRLRLPPEDVVLIGKLFHDAEIDKAVRNIRSGRAWNEDGQLQGGHSAPRSPNLVVSSRSAKPEPSLRDLMLKAQEQLRKTVRHLDTCSVVVGNCEHSERMMRALETVNQELHAWARLHGVVLPTGPS